MLIERNKVNWLGIIMVLVGVLFVGLAGGGVNARAPKPAVMDNRLVTGGANYSANAVTVSTFADLQAAIGSNKVIYVDGTIIQPGSEEIKLHNVSNLSLVGVADRGELQGIGLSLKNAKNVIIRNLTIHHVEHKFNYPNTALAEELTSGDAIGVIDSKLIWVDHCTLYNDGVDAAAQQRFKNELIGQGYTASEAEEWEGSPKNLYDGLFDVKGNSKYITFSWNLVYGSWKTSLVGSNDSDKSDRQLTYHHNWFRDCNSRLPMYRGGVAHIYNNYYANIKDSGINSRAGARLLIENNYFENVKKPIQSSDKKGTWLAVGNNLANGGTALIKVSEAYGSSYVLDSAAEAKVKVMEGAGAGRGI